MSHKKSNNIKYLLVFNMKLLFLDKNFLDRRPGGRIFRARRRFATPPA